jgi:tRNA U34 2-thiouridine synthase MnmA/TrmU
VAKKIGIPLIVRTKGEDYLDIVRAPKHGHGSGMNPCIDCRIYILKKAKELMEEIGAEFVFTGEVLGQRPMSQHRKALDIIEKESGLEGKLLRPLSAALLPPTEAELKGLVNRDALLAISGRSRKIQMDLAVELGMTDYPCPGGGCLLTVKDFAMKVRDHLDNGPGTLTMKDVHLLKTGRHFRISGEKIIVGRNKEENERLRSLAEPRHTLIEPVLVNGPTALVESTDQSIIMKASQLVARYCDVKNSAVQVDVIGKESYGLSVEPARAYEIEMFRVPKATNGVLAEERD